MLRNKLSSVIISSAIMLGSLGAGFAEAYPVNDSLSITLNTDALVIDPEVDNTTSIPVSRVNLLLAYGGFYGLGEYSYHPATSFNSPMLDDYFRIEAGVSLDKHNNFRVGLQAIPEWDMIGYRLRGLHNLNYGLQVEPWLGFIKSTTNRGYPFYNSSTTELGVTVHRKVTKTMAIRFGYETKIINKHTTLDTGFIGLSIGLL